MGIKAVGFDLDGTLYPAWQMYAVSADLGIRHPIFLHAFGRVRRALRAPGALDGITASPQGVGPESTTASSPETLIDSRQAASGAFRTFQASLVAERLGADRTATAAAIDKIIYTVIEEKFRHIRPFGGAALCLETLRDSGLKLGLLSDLPPLRKMELLGFRDYFDFVLCSEDFGALKPDPRPFSALAARFGLDPDSILYVGNKRRYDIAGARAAGMKTALIGRGKDPLADFTFLRWENLTRWILAQAHQIL